MKRAVLIIFLIGFCKVFASFEFDILGNITASTSFPIAQPVTPTTGTKILNSTEAIFGASLQIGGQIPKNSIKGVSVLLDIKFENETIVLGTNSETTYNNGALILNTAKDMVKVTGLNLGVGFATKFIFGSVNSLVPRDTVFGFGIGAKVLINSPNINLSGSPVLTPYLDIFIEQRFFVYRKLALVCGINIGADVVIASLNNGLDNFLYFYNTNANIMGFYPSLNIGLSIGLHFGN